MTPPLFPHLPLHHQTVLYPLTNFVIIGGDVLNLAGTLNFVACTWLETTIMGQETGAGLVRTYIPCLNASMHACMRP